MKKALYNADLFIADNSNPTHRYRRTNTCDIIDYVISSPAIFSNIQNLPLNNDLSSDHSAILFDFSTNIDKSTPHSIKVKLYHKADWDSVNSSISKQLVILQDQIFKVGLSSSKKKYICFNDSPSKMIKKAFLFHLKISLRSQDICFDFLSM